MKKRIFITLASLLLAAVLLLTGFVQGLKYSENIVSENNLYNADQRALVVAQHVQILATSSDNLHHIRPDLHLFCTALTARNRLRPFQPFGPSLPYGTAAEDFFVPLDEVIAKACYTGDERFYEEVLQFVQSTYPILFEGIDKDAPLLWITEKLHTPAGQALYSQLNTML